MKTLFGIAALLAATATIVRPCCAQTSPTDQAENTGQDPTNPVTRIDVRAQYRESGDYESGIYTLRMDHPFVLGVGWKVSTRLDLPFMQSDAPSSDNPNGDAEFGVSDILAQALFITPPQGSVNYILGGRLVIPTASQDQMGSGRWQLGPTVGVVTQMPQVSPGSFIGLLARSMFSVGGGDRDDISEFSLQPLVNINLVDRWFVTLSPEILMDMNNDMDMFLPFDVTIGKKIDDGIVLSVTADTALIKDYEQYDWKVEGRAGFFF